MKRNLFSRDSINYKYSEAILFAKKKNFISKGAQMTLRQNCKIDQFSDELLVKLLSFFPSI